MIPAYNKYFPEMIFFLQALIFAHSQSPQMSSMRCAVMV